LGAEISDMIVGWRCDWAIHAEIDDRETFFEAKTLREKLMPPIYLSL
jgi:hypothetical protein